MGQNTRWRRSVKPEFQIISRSYVSVVFRVPTTHDVLTLFDPSYPKSHLDLLNLALLGLQLVLFAVLPRNVARLFFLFYFAFWRGAYDAGLGWVLTKQSKKKWIVREVQKLGWLDPNRRPAVRNWIKAQLVGKMGRDYSFDVRDFVFKKRNRLNSFQELPLEYNTWLLFRQAVDVILLKFVTLSVPPPPSNSSVAISWPTACLRFHASESLRVCRFLFMF